jgi:hypothetical protein
LAALRESDLVQQSVQAAVEEVHGAINTATLAAAHQAEGAGAVRGSPSAPIPRVPLPTSRCEPLTAHQHEGRTRVNGRRQRCSDRMTPRVANRPRRAERGGPRVDAIAAGSPRTSCVATGIRAWPAAALLVWLGIGEARRGEVAQWVSMHASPRPRAPTSSSGGEQRLRDRVGGCVSSHACDRMVADGQPPARCRVWTLPDGWRRAHVDGRPVARGCRSTSTRRRAGHSVGDRSGCDRGNDSVPRAARRPHRGILQMLGELRGATATAWRRVAIASLPNSNRSTCLVIRTSPMAVFSCG